MADHLSYIRIRGLEADPEECFQGLGASGLPSSPGGGTGGGTGAPLEWGEFPQEVLTAIVDYASQQDTWLKNIEEVERQYYESEYGMTRGLPAVVENAPLVPVIIGTIASGGATLPVIVGEILIQIGFSVANAQLRKMFRNLDPDSPENQQKELINVLKKALLYAKAGETTPEHSILDNALNYDLAIDGKTEHHSVLKDKLEDLALVDVTMKYADNTNLSVKGKVLRR